MRLSSKLRIEAIKLKRKGKRLVQERYLSEKILNFLIEAKIFSIKIRPVQKLQLKIKDARNERKPKEMFFQFIAVAKLKDFKTFQRSVNMFDKNFKFRLKRVKLFFVFLRERKLTKSRFFKRHKRIRTIKM